MDEAPLLIALHRVGPYHRARFATLAARLPLVVLETRPHSREYPWDSQSPSGYHLERLGGHPDHDSDPPCTSIDRQIDGLIARHQPFALTTVGWADHSYQRLLLAAYRNRLPLLLISDSRYEDSPRTPLGELPKRLLLDGFSAALVAGSQSRDYLKRLGFPADAVFQPWDVVDNRSWQADGATPPLDRRQPPHWLCVSRFVAKKNHRILLEAYGRYQRAGGRWGLQLIGEGPMDSAVRAWIAALPNPAAVGIVPFQQFDSLRDYYHAARGLILASSSDQWGLVVNEAMAAGLPVLVSQACGCASDLIEEGRTGFLLDPKDPDQISQQLWRCDQLSTTSLMALQFEAASRISHFSPEAFASGIVLAAEYALDRPRFSRQAVAVAWLLSKRPAQKLSLLASKFL